jgi:hypothetical protein
MNATTRRRPAVALTRGDGFYDTTTANGGGDQRQRLPRHGEGKWQSQQVAMASTSRQRPTAASTVSSDLGLMGLNLDLGVFLFLKTDFSCTNNDFLYRLVTANTKKTSFYIV